MRSVWCEITFLTNLKFKNMLIGQRDMNFQISKKW